MKGEGAVMVTPGEDRGYRLAGLAVLLLGLGGLTVWGALAPIDSAVVASGQVQVESKRKTVQHLEGGQVGEIAVRDGDMVRRGDLLLRLDDTQLRAQLERVRWQYHNEQTIVARLAAERDGDEEITFSSTAASGWRVSWGCCAWRWSSSRSRSRA
jgi:multidrug efflux pump subunit AcrA (membrane-fusion protein)